jgi:hypothetical protein
VLSSADQLVQVNGAIRGKLLEYALLAQQAQSNSRVQFDNSLDLDKALDDAIIDAFDAHREMSSQALASKRIRDQIKHILLGPGQLHETLRASLEPTRPAQRWARQPQDALLLDPRRKLPRQRMLRTFVLPEHIHHPPALVLPQQLDAVDAAHEGLGVIWAVAGFVAAEGVGDVAEALAAAGDFGLEEALLQEVRAHRLDVLLDVHDSKRIFAVGPPAGRDHAGV